MVRCTTVVLALGIIAVVFTPSNAWRRRRRRRCLVRHCTVSSCLDWLDLVYATLRRRTDHSYAAKNCIGILWRGMCLSPTRNEKMKYRLLPCEHGVLGASAWGVGCQAILGRQLSKGTVRVAEKPALQNRPRLVTQTCEYH